MKRAFRFCRVGALAGAMLLALGSAGRAAALTTLYSFCTAIEHAACVDGQGPMSRLLQIGARFYGTTSAINVADAGRVFRVSRTGTFESLHVFCVKAGCSGGNTPGKYLTLGPDGEIYGVTTRGGGRGNGGTIFKLSTRGRLTTVYAFCSEPSCLDGSLPVAVVFDAAGNLFGSATGGGRFREGVLFEITAKGVYRKLYDFCSRANCADGLTPGALMLAKDGDFYGTTAAGGANQAGTVFRVTRDGHLTTLYSLCALDHCADGEQPTPVLVQGLDGNFYGTTMLGGANGAGTIFRLSPAGSFQLLHAFCGRTYCDDGGTPLDGLVRARDGSFYGTASGGGIFYNGVLFNITRAGKYTILHNFCATGGCFDGSLPNAAPTLARDGNLYGTTLAGGDNFNVGTVYKLRP